MSDNELDKFRATLRHLAQHNKIVDEKIGMKPVGGINFNIPNYRRREASFESELDRERSEKPPEGQER